MPAASPNGLKSSTERWAGGLRRGGPRGHRQSTARSARDGKAWAWESREPTREGPGPEKRGFLGGRPLISPI